MVIICDIIKNMKKIIIIIVLLLVVGGFLYVNRSKISLNDIADDSSKTLSNPSDVTQSDLINNISEISIKGTVLDNNQEFIDIGSYLQIKRDDNSESVYVVYYPLIDGVEKECLNKVDMSYLTINKIVEVKGMIIKEINGMKPKGLMVSTCESPEYYIKVIN